MKVSSTVLAEATPVDASAASPRADVATAVPMMVVRRFIVESLRLSVTLAGTGRFRESPWRILGRTLERWLADRQPDGGHRRRHLDRRAQHVAGDPAEPAHTVRDQRRSRTRARRGPTSGPCHLPRTGEHRQRRDRDDPRQRPPRPAGCPRRVAPSELPCAAGTDRRHAATAATRPAVTATITATALSSANASACSRIATTAAATPNGPGRTVAHHLQRPLRRPVTAERVGGVGQPVDVQAAGRDQQRPPPRARRRAGCRRRTPTTTPTPPRRPAPRARRRRQAMRS